MSDRHDEGDVERLRVRFQRERKRRLEAERIAERTTRDLYQRQLQLEAARDQAERSNRAKSRFLTNMSHELRTPLNSVIGFANLLRKNKAGNLGPTELMQVERIAANGMHLLGLISEVLDLAKVEAGTVELRVDKVELAPLVNSVLAQLAGQGDAQGVALAAELPARLDAVPADEERLRQVLINLLGNALKFGDGEPVTVRVVAEEAGRPLRIDVVDRGVGIAPEQLEVVFEPFLQLDAGPARKFDGAGLGLSIARNLCAQMGFEILVSSRVGAGSTFAVVLVPDAPVPEHLP